MLYWVDFDLRWVNRGLSRLLIIKQFLLDSLYFLNYRTCTEFPSSSPYFSVSRTSLLKRALDPSLRLQEIDNYALNYEYN